MAQTQSYGWSALTLGEKAEINACLAISLHRAGEVDDAREQLREATESAVKLARCGELEGFTRLCQATLELLPTDRAGSIWAEWLIGAAEAGVNEAASMIACFIRWMPEGDLNSVVASVETGMLTQR
jgi:hypothetical protein